MSTAPKQFGIHIKVKDFDRSFEFYTKFGFKPGFAYGPKEFTKQFSCPVALEKYRGVSFGIGDAIFELGEDHIAVKREVFNQEITSSKVSAMVDVDSVAKIREICEKNDFEIAKAEVDYPWGTRELVVRDPDGFILVFRERI